MLTRKQKEKIVKNLAEEIKVAKSVVFSDFKGLPVKDMAVLRRQLREKEVKMQVLKKTLLTIAFKEAGIKINAKELEGQIAVAVSPKDEIEAAKIIARTAKTNKNLKMVGGFLGKNVLSAEEIKALAKLPSKEELLARLVGALNAPVSGFVNVLAGNMRGLVQVLKAISETK